jgi:hypothetical protein
MTMPPVALTIDALVAVEEPPTWIDPVAVPESAVCIVPVAEAPMVTEPVAEALAPTEPVALPPTDRPPRADTYTNPRTVCL